MTELVFCLLVIGMVEGFVLGAYVNIRTLIENIISSIEERRFNKEYYLDHVDLVQTDTEFPTLVGVYKKRV